MIAKGRINGIEVTAGAINLSLLVVLLELQKVKQLFMVYNTQLTIKHHLSSSLWRRTENVLVSIALANMTRTTLAINELKKIIFILVCFTDPTAGGITASFAC